MNIPYRLKKKIKKKEEEEALLSSLSFSPFNSAPPPHTAYNHPDAIILIAAYNHPSI
jgi:hypothetical protein